MTPQLQFIQQFITQIDTHYSKKEDVSVRENFQFDFDNYTVNVSFETRFSDGDPHSFEVQLFEYGKVDMLPREKLLPGMQQAFDSCLEILRDHIATLQENKIEEEPEERGYVLFFIELQTN